MKSEGPSATTERTNLEAGEKRLLSTWALTGSELVKIIVHVLALGCVCVGGGLPFTDAPSLPAISPLKHLRDPGASVPRERAVTGRMKSQLLGAAFKALSA